jgi:uncharacterized membrane protein
MEYSRIQVIEEGKSKLSEKENPSRRDSNYHEKETDDIKEIAKIDLERLSQMKDAEALEQMKKEIHAEQIGKKRRNIFEKQIQKRIPIKRIFGTDEWFLAILELVVLALIFIVFLVAFSWIYYFAGIHYPFRQILYIVSAFVSTLGIMGILRYFFPEWYVT